MHIPRRFHRTTGFGDDVEAHQAVHAGNADGRQQTADGGGDQRHQQRHQKHQRQAATGKVCERLQGHDHNQKDQGQADQQDIQGDFVGGFLPLGAFDQGDHAVQGGLAGVGADLHQQPVTDQPRVAGYRRAITARLTDHRGRFTGNRRFVDCGNPFNHLAVAGDHLPRFDAHHIPFAQAGGRDDFKAARGSAPTRTQAHTARLEAIGPSLAATLGQGFGKVGEQHGKPQPQSDLHRHPGGHCRLGEKTQHRGKNRGQLDHQHHRRAFQLARVEFDECLQQRRTPDIGERSLRRLGGPGFRRWRQL